MKPGYLIILLTALLLGSLPAESHPAFLVTHFGIQNYNAGNQNWSVVADKVGFIYAGNNDGLLIFNGTDWKLLRSPDQTIVRSVYCSDDGRIYTGSFEECGYWEKDQLGEYSYVSLKPLMKHINLHNDEIWKIVSYNGKIYFQSFTSLLVYDKKTIHAIRIPGTIIFLLKAHDRLFVQAVNGVLYNVVGEDLYPVKHSEVLMKSEVKTILPLPDSAFLIGTTSRGFFRFDGKSVRPWDIPVNKLLKEYQINNAIVSGQHIIIGTIVQGILILDFSGKVIAHLNTENYLQNNTVLSLCSDLNGNIWAGLDRGIDRISVDQGVAVYQEKLEQLGAVYTAALFSNRLYIGTNRGIFTYEPVDGATGYLFNGLINNSQGQVWDLSVTDGQLICGHTNGTYEIRGNVLKQLNDISGGYILRILPAQNGEYLIQGTYSPLVVYKKKNGLWSKQVEIKGYQEPSRFLETDHLGNIWIGQSVKGLYKIRLNKALDSVADVRLFGKSDGLPSDFNIHVFKVENRVVFTSGHMLYTWDDLSGKIQPYTELNAKLSGFESATQISGIGNNRYWFIKKDDIALFLIGDGAVRMLIHVYLPSYGLRMIEGYEKIVRLDMNHSLLCLDNGFAIFDLDHLLNARPVNAKLIVNEIFCTDSEGNKKRMNPLNRTFLLPHSWNSISLNFSYANSNNIKDLFQTKLASIENEWSPLSGKTLVEYSRLPKGDYTFLVRTLDYKGMFTEPLSLHFIVFPAWYESPTAYILYVLLFVIAFVLSTFFFRRRFIRNQERLRVSAEMKAQEEKHHSEQEIIQLQNEKLQGEINHKTIQLADSTMSVIKKNELLIEIRKELDQQKKALGNEYPAFFFERIKSLISRNISNDQDWHVFEELFDQAHQDFFKRLKASYPDLTQSDLKLCAYLKLNLSSKEIAPLLNISFRGVETRRYRLRKRLALGSDSNLVDFIMQF